MPKEIEVDVQVYQGGLSDMESFDSVKVNMEKLGDPEYRQKLAANILRVIDNAHFYLTTGQLRTR